MMPAKVLVHFRVFGRVQGVFFRASTVEEAKKLGLKGWCHNHPDESVEGVAVGASDKVEELRRYLSVGPKLAHVKEVQYIKEISNPDAETERRMLIDPGKDFEKRRYKAFKGLE